MKKGKKATLWLFIALAASLAVIAGIYFLSIPRLSSIDEYASAPFADIDYVSIDGSVSHISVTTGGNEFKARLHGSSFSDEEFRAHLALSPDPADPGMLVIREQRGSIFRAGGREQLWLEVVLPENYYGGVKLNNVSGEIDAENLKTNALFVTSISGDTKLSNCSCAPALSSVGAMSVNSGSGGITLENVTANQLDISTTSGKVTARGCKAESAEAESISGAIELAGMDAGALVVSTTSGAIDAHVLSLTQNAQFDSMSGSISLTFPSGLPLSFDLSSVSGEVSQDYPSTEGGVPVVLVTLSGNQTVRPG